MEYITLNNGIKMPMIGLGTWDLRGTECIRSVQDAIDCGYRLIDTAQMYENEKEVGEAVRRSGISREELFITTKVCRPNNSYQGTKKAIEHSLEKLQIEYIDLFLVHEAYPEAAEMYQAMEEAYHAKKIRAIGISNFTLSRYKEFLKQCSIVPAVNQMEAHVFFTQRELHQELKVQGTHMQAWSPFTAGKKDIFHHPILKAAGKKYGKSAAQIALKYLVQKEISVIPKSSKKERMKENIALFDFNLSPEDMAKIQQLDRNESLFGWY